MSEKRQKRHPNLRAGAPGTKRKPAGKPFVKGQSGNPKGRKPGVPNKATREVKLLAQSILEDTEVQARMLQDARKGRLAPPVMTMLFHYAYGKPKERVELQGALEIFKILVTDDFDDEMGRDGRTAEAPEAP